jgi:anti-anti-sigma regulatory factor
VTEAPIPPPPPDGDPPPGVAVRHLGERTRVVGAGGHLDTTIVERLEGLVATAAAEGGRDFVFDLTSVERSDDDAVGAVVDLWRRLAALGCTVFVAVCDPRMTAALEQAGGSDATWDPAPSVADALRALLGQPA